MYLESIASYPLVGCIVSAAAFEGGELTFYNESAELIASDGTGQVTTALCIPYDSILHFRVVRAEQLMRITVSRDLVDEWAATNGFGSQLDPSPNPESGTLPPEEEAHVRGILQKLSVANMAHFLANVAPRIAAQRRVRSASRLSITEPLPLQYRPQDPSEPPGVRTQDRSRSRETAATVDGTPPNSDRSHISAAEEERRYATTALATPPRHGDLPSSEEAWIEAEGEYRAAPELPNPSAGLKADSSHDKSLSQRLAQLEQCISQSPGKAPQAGPLLRRGGRPVLGVTPTQDPRRPMCRAASPPGSSAPTLGTEGAVQVPPLRSQRYQGARGTVLQCASSTVGSCAVGVARRPELGVHEPLQPIAPASLPADAAGQGEAGTRKAGGRSADRPATSPDTSLSLGGLWRCSPGRMPVAHTKVTETRPRPPVWKEKLRAAPDSGADTFHIRDLYTSPERADNLTALPGPSKRGAAATGRGQKKAMTPFMLEMQSILKGRRRPPRARGKTRQQPTGNAAGKGCIAAPPKRSRTTGLRDSIARREPTARGEQPPVTMGHRGEDVEGLPVLSVAVPLEEAAPACAPPTVTVVAAEALGLLDTPPAGVQRVDAPSDPYRPSSPYAPRRLLLDADSRAIHLPAGAEAALHCREASPLNKGEGTAAAAVEDVHSTASCNSEAAATGFPNVVKASIPPPALVVPTSGAMHRPMTCTPHLTTEMTTVDAAAVVQPLWASGAVSESLERPDRKRVLREVMRNVRGVEAHVTAVLSYARELGDTLQRWLDDGAA